jgi:hypothetical protein
MLRHSWLFQCRRELFLDDRTKAANPIQPSSCEDAAEIIERAYLELVMQQLDTFWPEAGQCGDLGKLGRQVFSSARQEA